MQKNRRRGSLLAKNKPKTMLKNRYRHEPIWSLLEIVCRNL